MHTSLSRYLSLASLAVLLFGGGLYLARTRVRENARGHQPAASAPAGVGQVAAAADDEAKAESSSQPSNRGEPRERPTMFGLTGAVQLEEVPAGRFKEELRQLDEAARRVALDKLGKLQVPLNDVASLSVESNGQLFYQCAAPRRPSAPMVMLAEQSEVQAGLPGGAGKIEAAASVSILEPPIRHSRPGATKVIYLDFNGHEIAGTVWNTQRGNPGEANYRPAVTTYRAKAMDSDGFPGTFSDAEQAVIIQVWERIAEDYRCFDVDVTTEEPAVFSNNTGRILITQNVDENGQDMPASTAAGVAYLDVFGYSSYVQSYSPALVYANQNYNYAAYIAASASHEMGHNLSLSHDGTAGGDEYYDGHGTGETSWNTIMGSAYTQNVTQWSKGEYYNYTNKRNNAEDDLAEIATRLSYVPDDHTDVNATATPLTVSGLSVSGAGIISQTDEADRFSFEGGPGAISFTVSPFRSAVQTRGGNLDVALELYDGSGTMVASANVDGVTIATLNTTVSGGTYYLRVFGAGSGTPTSSTPTGYTNYGSLGQYTIAGTVISTTPVAPSITSQPVNQTVYAGQTAQFIVSASAYPAPTFQWQKGGVNITGATSSSYSLANVSIGDAGSYTVVATNIVGSTTSSAAVLVVNAATLPSLITQPASQAIPLGSPVTFSVVASGFPAPTYQWKWGGVNITGATSSSYTIAYVNPLSIGDYTVVATNIAGSVTSNAAVLAVVLAPSNAVISFTVQ